MDLEMLARKIDLLQTEVRMIKSMFSEFLERYNAATENHFEERIMSARDVAELLNIDIDVIYAKCAKDEIPHTKLGRNYKFRKTEILAWWKNQKEGTGFSVDDYVSRYLQQNPLKS